MTVTFGDRVRILTQKTGFKNAFRRISVDPDGAAVFGCVLGEYCFVGLRLQFGGRGSPGWWGVIPASMQHAQRNITRESSSFSQAGYPAVEHVTVAEAARHSKAQWPAECVVRPANGGGAGDPAFVFRFMDDAISVEVRWDPEGARCLRLTRTLAGIHEQVMAERTEGEEALLSKQI